VVAGNARDQLDRLVERALEQVHLRHAAEATHARAGKEVPRGRQLTAPRRTASVEVMSTLADRDRTALLVVDVQSGVVAEAHDRDAVVGRIATLVERARTAEVPVVWVQHSDEGLAEGSDPWQLVPELDRADTEPLVLKHYGDSFEDTDLEDVLARLGVGSLVVCGAQTDACVRSTLHGALTRGYDATLVGDAHTTEDTTAWGAPPPAAVIAHTNLYWSYQQAPGRSAGTVATDEVDFGVVRTAG
jgi:isochorismate hydrolase